MDWFGLLNMKQTQMFLKANFWKSVMTTRFLVHRWFSTAAVISGDACELTSHPSTCTAELVAVSP